MEDATIGTTYKEYGIKKIIINGDGADWTGRIVEGAEAILKVIMNKMNGTIVDIISKKAEEKIKEELAERIPEPKKVRKAKIREITYAGKYEIANNFEEKTKEYVIDILKGKKCSELMLIN